MGQAPSAPMAFPRCQALGTCDEAGACELVDQVSLPPGEGEQRPSASRLLLTLLLLTSALARFKNSQFSLLK